MRGGATLRARMHFDVGGCCTKGAPSPRAPCSKGTHTPMHSHGVQAVQTLARDAAQYGAPEAPMLAPALRAHFQCIEAAIDDNEATSFISALFELLIQLHKDGGIQPFVTAHVRHAYAVWWCMQGGDPRAGKEQLAAAQEETREAAAAAARPGPDGEAVPDELRDSFTFQARLNHAV